MQAFTLKPPFNMCVAGASGMGKSVWTCRLIRQAEQLAGVNYDKIIFAYAIWQPELYCGLQADFPQIEFHRGLPDFLMNLEGEDEFQAKTDHTLLVMDDLAYECRKVYLYLL